MRARALLVDLCTYWKGDAKGIYMAQTTVLPPVIAMLLEEPAVALSGQPSDAFKATRKLMPELRRQAEWTKEHFDYGEHIGRHEAGQFVTLPAGATDPFSRYGACGWIECRVKNALTFSRTFGLYADKVILPDVFTARALFQRRMTTEAYMDFHTDLVVLQVLSPLIKAGIVRFRMPLMRLCRVHHKEFAVHVNEITRELLPRFTEDLEVQVLKDVIAVSYSGVTGTRLSTYFPLNAQRRAAMEKASSPLAYARTLSQARLRIEMDMMMAEHMQAISYQAALLSTSRLHLHAVRSAEKRQTSLGQIDVWEDQRSAVLPWINELRPQEILRLRDEAGHALPRFRESVGKLLIGQNSATKNDSAEEFVHQLRAEAADVRAELDQLRASHRGVLRNAVGGSVGLTLSLYALATGAAVESSALLMGLLALLHNDSLKEHEQLHKIQSRPGYVLVKAEEFARHADEQTRH
jgi:hypothetical protein